MKPVRQLHDIPPKRVQELLAVEGYRCSALDALRDDGGGHPGLHPAEPPRQLVDGATFAFDAPDGDPALWGREDEVLMSKGEPTMLVGPQGVGKTTVAQRVLLAVTGIRSPMILGFPVAASEGRVLYVAADRPVQAQRSLRRMVGEEDKDALRERCLFWKGHLPFDIGRDPEALVRFVLGFPDIGVVVLDSLKDMAVGLTKDDIGSAVNRTLQLVIGEGIEILASHHQRKATSDNRKPKTLDDVYGSTWLTAGCGSVILLWGQPGDPMVELSHLKQPAAQVGPLQILIDHEGGTVEVEQGTDLLAILRRAPRGMTAIEAARMLYGATEPSKAEAEKARRKLNKLVEANLAYRRDGEGRFSTAVSWFATPSAGLQEGLDGG